MVELQNWEKRREQSLFCYGEQKKKTEDDKAVMEDKVEEGASKTVEEEVEEDDKAVMEDEGPGWRRVARC